MAAHNDLGKRGEKLALDYLLADEYEVLETNYRFSRAEIDIIAKKNNILVFVEVKSRTTAKHGLPEWAITGNKINLLMDTAYHYMEKVNHQWEIRFDVISLLLPKDQAPSLNHLKDAFVP